MSPERTTTVAGNLWHEFFSAIVSLMPIAAAVFDASGRLLIANDSFLRAARVKSRDIEVLERAGGEAKQVADAIRSAYELLKGRKDPEPISVEVSPEGQTPLHLHVAALIHDGDFLGMVVTEDMMARIAHLFQAVLDEASTRIMIAHDEFGTIIQGNALFTSLLGYEPAEIPRMKITDIEWGLTERKLAARIAELQERGFMEFEAAYRNRHGGRIHCTVRAIVIGAPGNLLVVNGAEPRIPKRATRLQPIYREFFVRAFNAIPIPAMLWEQVENDFKLVLYNEAANEFTGGSIARLIGASLSMIFPGMPEIYSALVEAAESGHPISGEIPCKSPALGLDGIFILSFSRTVPNFVAMTITDITKFIKMQRMLARQNEELSRFAHDMSHDVKGFLQQITLHLELLKEKYDDSRFEDIHAIVQQIVKILEESVQLADAGQTIAALEECPLDEILEEAAKAALPVGVRLKHKHLPTVLCDRSRVLQIFVNLFKNAVEHGQATRVEVSTETDQKFLSVLVSNNGRTIPEDMKKNLFRFRVSSKKHGGRGLLIVRRLAEAHDWHVDLLPAGRTTFRIRIPRRMVVSWR
ncbi:MAG: ATP-binding protein [Candidatus Thorarchaeota archaeon]|nr:MAG: hypothetical protein DRO93_09185 [Candidatus Thorarchaeota archaeon]